MYPVAREKPGGILDVAAAAEAPVSGRQSRMVAVNPDDPDLTPDAQAEEILRLAEKNAMEHPSPRRPLTRPWWYRGFTGRQFDWLDVIAAAVLGLTVLLVILGAAGVL